MLRWASPREAWKGLDDQQAGVFALRTGIGLQADAGVTRGLAEPGAQLLVEFFVALLLIGWCEGVDVCEFGAR